MNEIEKDQHNRWTPSEEQDSDAAVYLKEAAKQFKAGRLIKLPEHVWTVHLMVNKDHAVWDKDVQMLYLPGLFYSRDEAIGGAEAAITTHKLLRPDVKVSGGWVTHRAWREGREIPLVRGRTWKTDWAIFEL